MSFVRMFIQPIHMVPPNRSLPFRICWALIFNGSGRPSRMSHLSQKTLYGLEDMDMSALSQLGCHLGPTVDERLIGFQWDRTLKLLVSLQLKQTLASLVMKRLNSYAVHNPLYRALGELGKLVRTGFIMRYMDEEGLRHRIHQQQEKMETGPPERCPGFK